MEKNKREKDMLYKWACDNSEKYKEKGGLESVSSELHDSFFIKRNPANYLKEYSPNDLRDFHCLLHGVWGEDDAMRQVLIATEVAIMKNMPSIGEENLKQKKSELPGYIYNF